MYGGSEYLPAAAVAGAVLIGQGRITDYASFIDSLLESSGSSCYMPDREKTDFYDRIYTNYLKVYPAFKSIS